MKVEYFVVKKYLTLMQRVKTEKTSAEMAGNRRVLNNPESPVGLDRIYIRCVAEQVSVHSSENRCFPKLLRFSRAKN